MDREKVIEWLERCVCAAEHSGDFITQNCTDDCPYGISCKQGEPGLQIMKDALALLKEQEETIGKLYDLLDETCKDIRERTCENYVCGLCQFDADHGLDGYANECPGYETDECFCMKNEIRKICGKELVPEPEY